MLIAVERIENREDWQQLPEIQEYQTKFSDLLSDTQFSVAEMQSRLAALWPSFLQALTESPNLT